MGWIKHPHSIYWVNYVYKFILQLFYCYIYQNLIFHPTEKPRKPYGSGVSYVWTQRYLTITNLYSDCITR